jgi:ethanolamine ammonia-lyase large subunit
VVPYEHDEVTRHIIDTHDAVAFGPMAHLTVGDFRNWLLSDAVDSLCPRSGSAWHHA